MYVRSTVEPLVKVSVSVKKNPWTDRSILIVNIAILTGLVSTGKMAERSKALRSGRSPLLWAWRKIASTTTAHNHAYIVTGVGFGPTPTEVDCGLNAAPWTARPSTMEWSPCEVSSSFEFRQAKAATMEWSPCEVSSSFEFRQAKAANC
ncbi:hypothetical protein M513_11073 [Trichuris suis]|uniref:Uncharacterized protein n=1 Tax=Trichuris suis TaxID=68888 RepID=A0A085LSV7_9BILA|nr:hypothetical protein M513_11073 [Trichuris suis]